MDVLKNTLKAWFRSRNPASSKAVEAIALAPVQSVSTQLERKRLDGKSGIDQKNRHFVDVNAAYAKFVGVDFSASVFERVYFRKASFENCNFTGARFKDCNFRDATFLASDLRYVDFNRCLLNPKEVVGSLPSQPNWRKEVLQNLRANCGSTGDVRSISFLVLEEVKASRDHHRRALLGREEYYRKKYGGVLAKTQSIAALTYYNINGVVWGYGEKPFSLLVSLLSFLAILSLINFWAILGDLSWKDSLYGLRIFQYTFESFLNTGPDPKISGFIFVDYAIGALRYIYAGLLVTTLVRSISHR